MLNMATCPITVFTFGLGVTAQAGFKQQNHSSAKGSLLALASNLRRQDFSACLENLHTILR